MLPERASPCRAGKHSASIINGCAMNRDNLSSTLLGHSEWHEETVSVPTRLFFKS